ncbi:MAG TPA: TolC family protein [Candidatus Acidoferrales bacterium]|jgi:cobalt-zinc-cadmium efflux system outer membrane protein|nr:TolC family protein [Candidatus Acidoferrales bacterium]
MQQIIRRVCVAALLAAGFTSQARAQKALTWDEVRARFEANNPTLLADKVSIDESKAQQITAYLRPNPQLTLSADGTQIAPRKGVWEPFRGTYETPSISYLHERQHKRELRLESAQKGTLIAESTHADLERTLLFDLRGAFVSTLQARVVLKLTKDNLAYYDNVLDISRTRFSVGDIAQIDLDRLELQRVQYESDVQSAEVNLRTAKIQLLTLLNDRTPIEQIDVVGPFDFNDQLMPRDDFRKIALDTRPDLRAALEAVDKAQTDHKLAVANGSTDPILSAWYTHNSSNNNPFGINTLGVSVSIPLRIFDRNQGEKLRTQLDIDRNEKLTGAAQALVFSDVDSAYAVVNSNVILLQPYKAKYLQQAVRVRDTVFFAYQHGGASLVDFLNAQSEYRTVELSYVNLIGSYLTAAAQLNLAVGREVLQ